MVAIRTEYSINSETLQPYIFPESFKFFQRWIMTKLINFTKHDNILRVVIISLFAINFFFFFCRQTVFFNHIFQSNIRITFRILFVLKYKYFVPSKTVASPILDERQKLVKTKCSHSVRFFTFVIYNIIISSYSWAIDITMVWAYPGHVLRTCFVKSDSSWLTHNIIVLLLLLAIYLFLR